MPLVYVSSHIGAQARLHKNRIIVVDDDKDILLTLKNILVDNGFEVDDYKDSVDALKNFKPNLYGLLITDIRMPRLDGFNLYRKMRRKDPMLRVCFVSSFVDYYKAMANNLDLKCFIQKPFSVDEIMKYVKTEMDR